MPEANLRSPRATLPAGRPSRPRGTPLTTSPTCARACCSRVTPAGCDGDPGRPCSPSRRRPTSTSSSGTETIDEIERREPAQLALTHFGVVDDVAAHLAELRAELDRWTAIVASGADGPEFARLARRSPPDEAAGDEEIAPLRPVVARATALPGQAGRDHCSRRCADPRAVRLVDRHHAPSRRRRPAAGG